MFGFLSNEEKEQKTRGIKLLTLKILIQVLYSLFNAPDEFKQNITKFLLIQERERNPTLNYRKHLIRHLFYNFNSSIESIFCAYKLYKFITK